jgi:hypothetical protein
VSARGHGEGYVSAGGGVRVCACIVSLKLFYFTKTAFSVNCFTKLAVFVIRTLLNCVFTKNVVSLFFFTKTLFH